MIKKKTNGRWNGGGEPGGVGTIDRPARRAKVGPEEPSPPPAAPPTARRGGRFLWLQALLGGLLLCGVLFAVLGWIQPVFKKDQRVEIPPAVRVILKNQGTEKKKAKEVAKRTEPERKRAQPPQQKRRAEPTKIRRTAPIEQVTPSRARPQAMLKGSLLDLGLGGGGGPVISIAMTSQQKEVLEKAADIQRYERKRQEIIRGDRGGPGMRDSRGGGGAGSGGFGFEDGGARAQNLPPPDYPDRAYREQVEGWVTVNLLISRTGTVEKHEILGADPEGYFEEAIEEVLPRWQFHPALDASGRPIEDWKVFTYEFKLEDATI